MKTIELLIVHHDIRYVIARVLYSADDHIARPAVENYLDLMECTIEIRRLIGVFIHLDEARVDNRFAQPGGCLDTRCHAAREFHHYISSACLGRYGYVCCLLWQEKVDITAACIGRNAADRHARQV